MFARRSANLRLPATTPTSRCALFGFTSLGFTRYMPTESTSASSSAIKQKKESHTCPICDSAIKDATGRRMGQDAIECSGSCDTWLHRHCAGLSKRAFKAVSKSNDPFYCPQCRLDVQELELRSLKETIRSLTSEIASLKDMVTTLSSAISSATKQEKEPHTCSTCDSIMKDVPVSNGTTKHVVSTEPRDHQSLPVTTGQRDKDRQTNVVFFGVDECAAGTSKPDRLKSDIDAVSKIISDLNCDVNPQSIRDCVRLGKFVVNNKPRPILAKLSRLTDVFSILKNGKSAPSHIRIKADMSKETRVNQAVLLRERWSLIQSGIEKKDIKIRASKLLVKGSLHGHVQDSIFIPASAQDHSMSGIKHTDKSSDSRLDVQQSELQSSQGSGADKTTNSKLPLQPYNIPQD